MNLKLLALAGVFAAAVALASCETMSAEECAGADWGQLGYTDADGNGQDRFASRAESCAEKGYSADADTYRRGWAEGLRSFCQPYRAFSFARAGSSFSGSCPADLDQDFRYAYADGRRVYDLQQEINNARSEISRLEERRRDLDDQLDEYEGDLDDSTLTEEQRRHIRNRIDEIRRERRDANDDLDVANRNVPRLERLMSDLRYDIGGRWGPW
jgi:hypothetical protein